MPYIPQFNKLSMAEMAYAPTLMRQQHDEAIAKQMELADALKFDYLKQDANILEPVLNKYSEDIDKVSTDLAKQGFTQDTKSKLLGLRSKYTTDDKIRTVKKRYSDAMSGWEDRKKSLLQQRASGEDINAMRKAYFDGITPAYDDEGFKQDLTPGSTSNVYDISEDIKNKFANIGSSEVVYGGSGVKAVREVLGKGTPYERSAWKILDSTGGTKSNNLSQREAVKALTLSEYTDPSSDRALYAKLTNKSPEYISGLVDQWSDAMAKDQIGQVAQTRGSYEFDKDSAPPTNQEPLPKHNIPEFDKDRYDQAQNDEDILTGNKQPDFGISKSTPQNPWEKDKFFERETSERAKKEIATKYKSKYPKLFDKGIPENQAAIIGAKYDKGYSGINSSFYALKSKDVVENIYNSILKSGDAPTLERVNKKGDSSIKSIADIAKTFEGTGIDWKQVPPLVNPYGVTLIRDVNDNLYKVNESTFDETTQGLKKNVIKPVIDQLLDPQLFDKENQQPVEVSGARSKYPNGLFLDVDIDRTPGRKVDQYNVDDRVINMVTPSGNFDKDGNPLYYKIKSVLPGELTQELISGIGSGFQSYVKF